MCRAAARRRSADDPSAAEARSRRSLVMLMPRFVDAGQFVPNCRKKLKATLKGWCPTAWLTFDCVTAAAARHHPSARWGAFRAARLDWALAILTMGARP
jgi:hypothetical protein